MLFDGCQELHFAAQAHPCLFACPAEVDDLDRHLLLVVRSPHALVNRAHSAGADPPIDPVVADRAANERVGRFVGSVGGGRLEKIPLIGPPLVVEQLFDFLTQLAVAVTGTVQVRRPLICGARQRR